MAEKKRHCVGASVTAAEYKEVREWLSANGVQMKRAILRGLGALISGEIEMSPRSGPTGPANKTTALANKTTTLANKTDAETFRRPVPSCPVPSFRKPKPKSAF